MRRRTSRGEEISSELRHGHEEEEKRFRREQGRRRVGTRIPVGTGGGGDPPPPPFLGDEGDGEDGRLDPPTG